MSSTCLNRKIVCNEVKKRATTISHPLVYSNSQASDRSIDNFYNRLMYTFDRTNVHFLMVTYSYGIYFEIIEFHTSHNLEHIAKISIIKCHS